MIRYYEYDINPKGRRLGISYEANDGFTVSSQESGQMACLHCEISLLFDRDLELYRREVISLIQGITNK